MKLNKKVIVLIAMFLVGVIAPFITEFVLVEMFFLLIPFGVVFIGTLIYFVVCLFDKNASTRKALFIFSLLPIFILSQLLSGFTIDRIQRYRSENLINDLHKIKKETGSFPVEYEMSLMIRYKGFVDQNRFLLEYSRGFMVTEKYDSREGKWDSYGWND